MKTTLKYFFICGLIASLGIILRPAVVAAQNAAVTCLSQATIANGLDLNIEDAIALCHGATVPLAPINCFIEAFWDQGIDYELSIQLCSKAQQARAPIACYLEALNLNDLELSSVEAVNLCSAVY